MHPLNNCPFYDRYLADKCEDFCDFCNHYISCPELCTDEIDARICELNAMDPVIDYIVYEPLCMNI